MTLKSGRPALVALVAFAAIGWVGTAAAQGAGVMEAVMERNVTLPQTAWIKGETLGESAIEQKLRETVNSMLRQRGYLQENFSPYAVRIEIRGAGLAPSTPAIPQYSNPQPRLSLWNATAAPDAVTVSLLLYHQSTGRAIWQAEATCRGIPPDFVAGAMIVPMMEQFGRSAKISLGCARAS